MARIIVYILIFGVFVGLPATYGQSPSCHPANSSVDPTMITTDNKRCFFPFMHEDKLYDDCAGDGRKWCPTTCNLQVDLQFSYCQWEKKNLLRESCKNLTSAKGFSEPENVAGTQCVFPFVFKNECYETCTMEGTTYIWCGHVASVDLNPLAFSRCHYQRNTTEKSECAHVTDVQKYSYPDTMTEARCVFPFLYGEECKNDCIDTGELDYWCSTSKVYTKTTWSFCKFFGNIKTYETILKHGLYAIYAECSHSSFCGGAVVSNRNSINETVILVKDSSPYAIRVWEVIPQPDNSIIIRVPLYQSQTFRDPPAWTFSSNRSVILGSLDKYKSNVRFVLNRLINKSNIFNLHQIIDKTPSASTLIGFRGTRDDSRPSVSLEEVPLPFYWRFELLREFSQEDLKYTNNTFLGLTTPEIPKSSVSKTFGTSPTDVSTPRSTTPPVTEPSECSPRNSSSNPRMITDDNKTCFFPFVYDNVTYEDCAGDSKKWCATTCNLNRDLQFSWCRWEVKNLLSASCKNISTSKSYSEPNTESGAKCVFPFVYKNECYDSCTMTGSTYIWCGNVHSVDLNLQAFSRCLYQRESINKPDCANISDSQKYRYPDTESGKSCIFPFMNGETCERDCTDSADGYWCSETKVYGTGNWTFCRFMGNIKSYETVLKHGLYSIYANCTHSSLCGGAVVSSRNVVNEPILLASGSSPYAIQTWEVIPQPGSSVIIRVPLQQSLSSRDQLAWTFSSNGSVILASLGRYKENTRFELKNVTGKIDVFGLTKIVDTKAYRSSMLGFRGAQSDSRQFVPLEEVPVPLLWRFALLKEFTQDDLKDTGVIMPEGSTSGFSSASTMSVSTASSSPSSKTSGSVAHSTIPSGSIGTGSVPSGSIATGTVPPDSTAVISPKNSSSATGSSVSGSSSTVSSSSGQNASYSVNPGTVSPGSFPNGSTTRGLTEVTRLLATSPKTRNQSLNQKIYTIQIVVGAWMFRLLTRAGFEP